MMKIVFLPKALIDISLGTQFEIFYVFKCILNLITIY